MRAVIDGLRFDLIKRYRAWTGTLIDFYEQSLGWLISRKQEVPFMKLILDPDKSIKIQELLKANIQLGIKYRSIWNETAEIYKE